MKKVKRRLPPVVMSHLFCPLMSSPSPSPGVEIQHPRRRRRASHPPWLDPRPTRTPQVKKLLACPHPPTPPPLGDVAPRSHAPLHTHDEEWKWESIGVLTCGREAMPEEWIFSPPRDLNQNFRLIHTFTTMLSNSWTFICGSIVVGYTNRVFAWSSFHMVTYLLLCATLFDGTLATLYCIVLFVCFVLYSLNILSNNLCIVATHVYYTIVYRSLYGTND
jgi:hypothetical protein